MPPALKERGLRCFYDAEEQVGLWGKYLAEELPAIYGEQAAAVVVFISAEYAAKLAGLDIAAPPPSAVPPTGPVDVVLAVTGGQVQLSGGGAEACAAHGGVRPGLTEAVHEARRARDQAGLPVRDLAGARAASSTSTDMLPDQHG